LPRFCHNSLCRRDTTVRAACAHRYDMLSGGQRTIVGMTLHDRIHSHTIYHHSKGLLFSKFGASLDRQMSHRARRPCSGRLASQECEVSQCNNEQATHWMVVFFHATDYFCSGSEHKSKIDEASIFFKKAPDRNKIRVVPTASSRICKLIGLHRRV